jgi:hypothetical protein
LLEAAHHGEEPHSRILEVEHDRVETADVFGPELRAAEVDDRQPRVRVHAPSGGFGLGPAEERSPVPVLGHAIPHRRAGAEGALVREQADDVDSGLAEDVDGVPSVGGDGAGGDDEADLLALERGAVIGLDDFEADQDGRRRGPSEEEDGEERDQRRGRGGRHPAPARPPDADVSGHRAAGS